MQRCNDLRFVNETVRSHIPINACPLCIFKQFNTQELNAKYKRVILTDFSAASGTKAAHQYRLANGVFFDGTIRSAKDGYKADLSVDFEAIEAKYTY